MKRLGGWWLQRSRMLSDLHRLGECLRRSCGILQQSSIVAACRTAVCGCPLDFLLQAQLAKAAILVAWEILVGSTIRAQPLIGGRVQSTL